MNTNEEKDQFEFAVMEILGPDALAGGKLSPYEIAERFWQAGRAALRAESEPVATLYVGDGGHGVRLYCKLPNGEYPLYTAPQPLPIVEREEP